MSDKGKEIKEKPKHKSKSISMSCENCRMRDGESRPAKKPNPVALIKLKQLREVLKSAGMKVAKGATKQDLQRMIVRHEPRKMTEKK